MGDLTSIVDRLEAQLGSADRPPVPLEGGITNRNYRISFAGRDCVLRLPGKDTALLGISRDAERIANEAAARLGIAPAVVAADPDCLVTEYVPCREITSGEVRGDPGPVARALRSFHDHAAPLPVGFWVPDLLDDYAEIVSARGRALPPEYDSVRGLVRRIAAVLPLDAPVPCHNDLLPANLLGVEGGGVMLVDWEYAGMGHRMFDLGNLAVNNELDPDAELELLTVYLGRVPAPADTAALRLMRIMSDAREAAWGVVQAVISELEFDFSDYAAKHFARLGRAAETHELEEWLDAATA